jgi:hypothetical protein
MSVLKIAERTPWFSRIFSYQRLFAGAGRNRYAAREPRFDGPAEPGFSAKRFDCGGGVGDARLMSHHMSNFTRASDELVGRGMLCIRNVRRSTPCTSIGSISLIEVSPPHAGHSPSTPIGADWGACTLYPFAFECFASPWEITFAIFLRPTEQICPDSAGPFIVSTTTVNASLKLP